MSDGGFWQRAEADPDPVALVEPDGTEHTAGELLAYVNQLSHALRGMGLEREDRVAVMLPNDVHQVAAMLATGQCGWQLVPINHHLTGAEAAYIVDDSGAKVFITHVRFADEAAKALATADIATDRCFTVGAIDGFSSLAELVEGQPTERPDDRKAGGLMTYTSGTTGRPKGVARPLFDIDPDLLESVAFLNGLFGIEGDHHVHLTCAPLYHTAVVNFLKAGIHAGHKIVLMDGWDSEGFLRRVQEQRVTTTHMVPTMFNRLLALPQDVKDRYDMSSWECAIHSAAPCPPDVKRAMFDWWGPVIYEYYAASEGGGTLATPEDWLRKPGTVGNAWPISEVKVLDDDGRELPPGEVGTVWMRMGDRKFDYHGDEAKTKEAWNEAGFFTVGDAGELDEDGFLFLRDRKADLIISGGVNIYPAEVEAAMIAHPDILDVAVFGIPNDDFGEEVRAAVEVTDGVTPDDAWKDEVLVWCREHIAKFKCPRGIDVPDEFPRDPNGKVYKRRLRDPYWEGRDSAIV